MRPSQASAALRQIASRIDQSRSPDRALVARNLRRVLAAMGQTVYRVITDEPQGVCVGFKPSQELLDAIPAVIDEWNLVADDGSDGVVILGDKGTNDVFIRATMPTDEEREQGHNELGPDMVIWHNEAELAENFEVELPDRARGVHMRTPPGYPGLPGRG